MKNVIRYSLASPCLILAFSMATAHDLGKQGTTWPIAEPDMRVRMAFEASGHDWKKERESIRESAKDNDGRATSWDIPPAETLLTRFVDPSYTLKQDVRKSPDSMGEGGGEVIVPAGTTINPLEHQKPQDWLYVFDASLEGQIKQAKRLVENADRLPAFKLVITDGDFVELTEEIGQKVYRADKWLFTHAGVRETPSVVGVSSERPLRLKVTAFAPQSSFNDFKEAMQ